MRTTIDVYKSLFIFFYSFRDFTQRLFKLGQGSQILDEKASGVRKTSVRWQPLDKTATEKKGFQNKSEEKNMLHGG